MTATGADGAARDSRLVDSVKDGDSSLVRRLIVLKLDVNATEPDGASALHWAVERDRVDLADMLLKAGARPDMANDYGVTPLTLAAANGNAPIIVQLIEGGAKPNTALPTGETALMTAAHTGRIEAVRALINHGADVNARENIKGQTALMWSIWQGHDDVTRVLINTGADITATSDSGFTPLLFAVREGNLPIVRALLGKGAGVMESSTDGNTALHVAVVRGHVDMAKFLLNQGADANASVPGFTPLHWAAATWETGHSHDYIFNETAVNLRQEWSALAGIPTAYAKHDLIKALIAHGADVNARMEKRPPRFGHSLFKTELLPGATPFYLATITADLPTMRLLLANGADPAIGSANNKPLIVAAGLGRVEQETRVPESHVIEAIQLLLETGADINETNGAGNTPLHAATMAGLDNAVTYLAQHGAALSPRNKQDETPLKQAHGFIDKFLLYMRPSTAAVLEKLGATE
jgi:ankyrin repeat protein